MDTLPFDNTKKQAVIFIGIQACGKSTFYQRHLSNLGYVHISLDVLKTRDRESQMLAKCINEGKSFVVDNTNPEMTDRSRYITKAKEHGYHIIGIFFQSIVRACIVRNDKRGGKVPTKAIAATSNKLQLPSYSEGFDELFFAKIVNNNYQISKWK